MEIFLVDTIGGLLSRSWKSLLEQILQYLKWFENILDNNDKGIRK